MFLRRILQHLRPRTRRTTNRPAPGQISDNDIAVMNAYGLSPLDWWDLTDTHKAKYRDAWYRSVGL